MFDENSIADRILSGDESAFDRLVDRYEHKVYQYALRFLGQEGDACLATEEIFYQIYRKLNARTDAQLSTWVFRVVANVCADFQHHKRGMRGAAFSDAVSRLREPFVKGAEHDLGEEIQIQLLRLTRQQREVLLLRDLCGLSDEETGQILELDTNGVRMRLSRARKNLRELLLHQNALDQPAEKGQRYSASRDCQTYRELCSQYVDGCIAEADKGALLDHIQECGACAAYLNDLTVIGRSMSHMEETAPPDQLREKIISAARLQSEQMQMSRRREFHLPMFLFVVAAAAFLLLVSSGVLGGLFVNSRQGAHMDRVPNGGEKQATESLIADGIRVPDTVAASSYAFVIGAAGDTELPELSTSATLISGDQGNGVEYYSVDNDMNLVQKLTDGLESVGYKMETVNSHQIVISANAPQGLFIVVHH